MPINNPEAIRFTNEIIRPMCEDLRALKARIVSAQTRWYAGMNGAFTNDSTAVADGREGELVSKLTGADVNNVMSQIITLATNINDEIVEKPCVRALTVG